VTPMLRQGEVFQVKPTAQARRVRSGFAQIRPVAAVLVLGTFLLALVLFIGGSDSRSSVDADSHLGARRPPGATGTVFSDLLNFDYNPLGRSAGSELHAPDGLGIRRIAHSSVNLPPEKGEFRPSQTIGMIFAWCTPGKLPGLTDGCPLITATYVDSNPGVPASGSAWGPSQPGPSLPGTLGDQALVTTMGGATASGSWEAETCDVNKSRSLRCISLHQPAMMLDSVQTP
jgi:hypothetical protein